MKTAMQTRFVLATIAALACAPALAQFGGASTSAVSRVTGNTAITGITVEDSTSGTLTDGAPALSQDDRALLSSVVNALAADARMNGAQVEVQVSDGRVVLGGVVRDGAQSSAARSIADAIAGSTNVTNRLTTGG